MQLGLKVQRVLAPPNAKWRRYQPDRQSSLLDRLQTERDDKLFVVFDEKTTPNQIISHLAWIPFFDTISNFNYTS